MITSFNLTAALAAIGDAELFFGDMTVAGGMLSLGAKEGDATDNTTWLENVLTANELTGNVPHAVTVRPDEVSITYPMIIGGSSTLWGKVNPTGSKDGFGDKPVPVVTGSAMLIPRAIIPDAGFSYNGTIWSPVGFDSLLVDAIFFPKAYVRLGPVSRPFANGGKGITTVTIRAMYYAAGPAGKRIWVRGDPVAAGYTTFRA